ncbi:MAG TPA: methyltransferase [Bacteroidaceae bacterium]|nr:methyltransferase [Bacteroidaceae bacterium]
MNSKERVIATLNHQQPDKVAVDFGGTGQTGIHVQIVEKLREYFGLERKAVKVAEPYQMLGEIEDDLLEILGGDVIGLNGRFNMFGIEQKDWVETRTPWGQIVLMPGLTGEFRNDQGDWIIYPLGDTCMRPSGRMPESGYFFDAEDRSKPVDDATLTVEQNMEEYTGVTDEDLRYWKALVEENKTRGKALAANPGGTSLGDVALVPGVGLKDPKGIRDISEWYRSLLIRPDFIKELFDRITDLAINNLEKYFAAIGNDIDLVFLCGTDFGTQNSTFCDADTFRDLWLPYYRKVSDWIHSHTRWKVFKHSCGAIEPLMESFIDSGIDIINPVQVSAAGMDPEILKKKYGDRIVFWGGGVDTQHTLPFGRPEEVREMVLRHLEIFSPGGGYVFNTVHNTQALTPIENFLAMLNAVREFNGDGKI